MVNDYHLTCGEYRMPQSLYQKIAIKPLALAAAIALSMGAISMQTYADAAAPAFYQVQSGSLTQALNSLAQQANVSLLLNSAKTGRYQVQAVKGRYTPDQLFAVLVQNTPFEIQKTAAGYVLTEKPGMQALKQKRQSRRGRPA